MNINGLIALKRHITNVAMNIFGANNITSEEAAFIMRASYQDFLELAHTDLITAIMSPQKEREYKEPVASESTSVAEAEEHTASTEEFLEMAKETGLLKKGGNPE